MFAHEFEAKINPDCTLAVPKEIAAHIPQGQPIRVIVLLQEMTEDEEWDRMATEVFFEGFDEGDAIYDELSKP
jgi:hypothetical protein